MMEKVNKQSLGCKKIFLRKEIEQERLGEEIYAEDILCQYSVYLVRKFDEKEDYQSLEQMEKLLAGLPGHFNGDFQDVIVKKMFVRTTTKSIYVTLLLALSQPLSKLQIADLKDWMSKQEVSTPSLEHTSQFAVSADDERSMVREWQETTSEVLLLTEMMNQFNENLTEIHTELQAVKKRKTPPVMRVVKSEAAAQKVIEKENKNSTRLDETVTRIEKLETGFQAFQDQIMKRLEETEEKSLQAIKEVAKKTAGSKKPPKFKIFFEGQREETASVTQQLKQLFEQVGTLSETTKSSQEEIKKLIPQVEESVQKTSNFAQIQRANAQTDQEQSKLAEKMVSTDQEVTVLTGQLTEITEKMTAIETKITQAERTSEEIAQMEENYDQLNKTVFEAMKLNQVVNQLSKKLKEVETELLEVKNKKVPVFKLKKDETRQYLSEQHYEDQKRLKANELKIEKLHQTVGEADIQLSQAQQKIAQLEEQIRKEEQESFSRKRELEATMVYRQKESEQQAASYRQQLPVQKQTVPAIYARQMSGTTEERPVRRNTRQFPSKEEFLQASRPVMDHRHRTVQGTEQSANGSGVTLSIEEVLNKVSNHPVPAPEVLTPAVAGQTQPMPMSFRRLKKLESDIAECFRKVKNGLGNRGMIAKEDLYANIRQIEVIPYLWSMIYTGENPRDIRLNNEFSCQKLVNEVPEFLEQMEEVAAKRKVMGKWVYAPKELEQKMEGYKLLNEYFELCVSNTPT